MQQFSKSHLTALWSVTGIGRQSFKRCLLAQKKAQITDEEFWSNTQHIWQKSLLTKKQEESIKKFKKEHNFTDYYQQLKNKKIRVLLDREPAFPSLLKNCDQYPPVLFVKACAEFDQNYWQNLFLAVVGTRRITGYGRLIIKTLLHDLLLASQAKLVSGFMYGVDVEAMKMAHQLTQTIGVLGYGFDFCYPRHQQALMEKMLEEGAIFISEYAPAVQPSAGSFVQRNQIIAGLAQAVLLIEGADKSGSLLTAQCAIDEGRPVLAVPGPITNPYSVACHRLIKEGANLVSNIEDFYVALNLPSSRKLQKKALKNTKAVSTHLILASEEEKILNILKNQGTAFSFDQLLVQTQYSNAQLAEYLLNMQIKQIIQQEGQNYILKT
jgi:DNA processing protein